MDVNRAGCLSLVRRIADIVAISVVIDMVGVIVQASPDYTGSGGTHIPPEVQSKLDELHGVAVKGR